MRARWVLAGLLAGCAGSAAAPDAAAPDASTVPRALAFVITDLAIEPDAMGRVHGLDLDGYEGETPLGDCTAKTDFLSIETGETGVDDQLSVLSTLTSGPDTPTVAEIVHEDVTSGALLLVIALDGIDGLDDPEVGVRVARVLPDASGAVGVFAVAPGSAVARTTGALAHGRLSFALDVLPAPITMTSPSTSPPPLLHAVRVEAVLGDGVLTDGVLAGAYLWSEICAGVHSKAGCDALGTFLDLDPVASGVATTYTPGSNGCVGLSAGFGFTTAPALFIE
jgi:hypothetical protein